MKKTLIAVAVVASLGAGASAYADMGNMMMNGDFYVGGGLGASNTTTPGNQAVGSSGNTSTGLASQAWVGYNVMQYFGVELGYNDYANATVNNYGGGATLNIKAQGVNLGFVFRTPDFNGFNVFAKVGPQYTNTVETSAVSTLVNDSVNIFYGAGVAYDITQHLSAQFQWQQTPQENNKSANTDLTSSGLGSFDVPRYDIYTVGLNYKF